MKMLSLAVALLALAGCIAPANPDATTASSNAPSPSSTDGTMTAEESHSDTTMPCVDGLNLNAGSVPDAFCAIRTLTVQGKITGITALPVDLTTGSGSASVGESAEGSWSLVATITAHGSTPDDAKANLDNGGFTWSHEDAGTHHIRAETRQNASNSRISVSLALKLPPSVVMDLRMGSGSGDVSVAGGKTDGLVLTTGSGSIDARTHVKSATLRAGSGDISATLTPDESGSISATTGSGGISLALPEDTGHGYDVAVSTGSGSIDIGLKDGTTSACPEKGSCHERDFKTSGYDDRNVRSRVILSAGSGDVKVTSA